MSDPNVRRAEAARMSDELQRILRNKDFKSEKEFREFMQSLVGKSFDDLDMPEPTPRDKAQDLVFDAWEEKDSGRRIGLARQAIKLWPDCADAYCVLAEEAATPAEARRLFEDAVAAGERAVGPEPFKQDVGKFWGIYETRPYMRARFALAGSLWSEGESEAAIQHARELLRLNPDDNQGIRNSLVGWLLATGKDRAAIGLLERYDDESAGWEYARALVEFRTWGEADRACHALDRAFESNDIVPEYLLALRSQPEALPDAISLGSNGEALIVLRDLGAAWRNSPGAIEWLRGRWLSQARGRGPR